MEYGIKFRPIKPRSPHPNGKVERTQKTDLEELYANVDPGDPELKDKLKKWQFYFNWHRSHGALYGKAPIDKVCELDERTPFWEDVEKMYAPEKERLQPQDYRTDLRLRRLERIRTSI